MLQIPREGDTPLIKLFQNVEELQRETGQRVFHGIFDPTTNTILATIDSVAHEVGHYRDLKSGRLRNISAITEPHKKMEARLRNEIVAILFASSKCGDAGTSLPYEIDFLSWLDFTRKQSAFGPAAELEMKDLKLNQIQDLADYIADSSQPWFEKLEYIFRQYLGDEHEVLTYNIKS
jgi:hypothetical protein